MRKLVILTGIPAAGKSTIAARMIQEAPGKFIRINRDDLRAMVSGPGNNPHSQGKEREDLIRSMKELLMKQAFDAGYDVILDDTHLVPATVKKLHKFAESYGDVRVLEKAVNIDLKEAIERDSKRVGFARVGEKVITDIARSAGIDKGRVLKDKEVYYSPKAKPCEPIVQDESLPKAIMSDLDGTLAIIGDRSPYDATDCDVKDKPNWPVINCVLAMHAKGYKVIFMSGRDQKYRLETQRFIEKYCCIKKQIFDAEDEEYININESIPYKLHMRGETAPDPEKADMRKDSIIKQELFDKHVRGKFNIEFVLDDRDQVVAGWRQMGLTVFQVAEGRF